MTVGLLASRPTCGMLRKVNGGHNTQGNCTPRMEALIREQLLKHQMIQQLLGKLCGCKWPSSVLLKKLIRQRATSTFHLSQSLFAVTSGYGLLKESILCRFDAMDASNIWWNPDE